MSHPLKEQRGLKRIKNTKGPQGRVKRLLAEKRGSKNKNSTKKNLRLMSSDEAKEITQKETVLRR